MYIVIYNFIFSQVQFERITFGLQLDDGVLADMSRDQRLLYEYCRGCNHGLVDERWSKKKIGAISQSRWLTLATRILAMYCRTQNPSVKLKTFAKFIVGVYALSWFEIKKSSCLKDGPKIVFSTIQNAKKVLPPNQQKTILESIIHSAFSLLQENVLYAMLMDSTSNNRRAAVKAILRIRNQKNAPKSQRLKIPTPNLEATKWEDLIDLSKIEYECPVTRDFSDEMLEDVLTTDDCKLELPHLPLHSQGVERVVKLVTEVSAWVFGFQKRHDSIHAISMSREMRPLFDTKKEYRFRYDLYDP